MRDVLQHMSSLQTDLEGRMSTHTCTAVHNECSSMRVCARVSARVSALVAHLDVVGDPVQVRQG